MSSKKSPIYSVLNNKCPRCHEGNFFETNNLYNLKKFGNLNDRCPKCNEDFRREPGYYFGATYVSYGLTVGFGLGLYLLLCVAFTMEVVPFIITLSVLLILLLPVFYRFSRLIWIHMFVKYKEVKKT
ncbi:DUF983 domain-containing protein [soil metagenome]